MNVHLHGFGERTVVVREQSISEYGLQPSCLANCSLIRAPGYLYQLLAAVIKGNHTNCSQFANSHRLNWLFSRLGSAGEGTGMLDVLHCVLIDSPEALNVMKVRPWPAHSLT